MAPSSSPPAGPGTGAPALNVRDRLVAARGAAIGRPLDRGAVLAAAAQLDWLGVEVLGAVEALGLAEADVGLVYVVEIEDATGSADLPVFALLAADEEGVPRVIRAVRCEAWRRG